MYILPVSNTFIRKRLAAKCKKLKFDFFSKNKLWSLLTFNYFVYFQRWTKSGQVTVNYSNSLFVYCNFEFHEVSVELTLKAPSCFVFYIALSADRHLMANPNTLMGLSLSRDRGARRSESKALVRPSIK